MLMNIWNPPGNALHWQWHFTPAQRGFLPLERLAFQFQRFLLGIRQHVICERWSSSTNMPSRVLNPFVINVNYYSSPPKCTARNEAIQKWGRKIDKLHTWIHSIPFIPLLPLTRNFLVSPSRHSKGMHRESATGTGWDRSTGCFNFSWTFTALNKY